MVLKVENKMVSERYDGMGGEGEGTAVCEYRVQDERGKGEDEERGVHTALRMQILFSQNTSHSPMRT